MLGMGAMKPNILRLVLAFLIVQCAPSKLIVPKSPDDYSLAISEFVVNTLWSTYQDEGKAKLKSLRQKTKISNEELEREIGETRGAYEAFGFAGLQAFAFQHGIIVKREEPRFDPVLYSIEKRPYPYAVTAVPLVTIAVEDDFLSILPFHGELWVVDVPGPDREKPVELFRDGERAFADSVFARRGRVSLLQLKQIAEWEAVASLEQVVSKCDLIYSRDIYGAAFPAYAAAVYLFNGQYPGWSTYSSGYLVHAFLRANLEQPQFQVCPWILHATSQSALNFQGVYKGSKILALRHLAYAGKVFQHGAADNELPDITEGMHWLWEFLNSANAMEALEFFDDLGTKPEHWGRIQQWSRTLLKNVDAPSKLMFAQAMAEYGLSTDESLAILNLTRKSGEHTVDITDEGFVSPDEYKIHRQYAFHFDADKHTYSVPIESWLRGIDTCKTPVFSVDRWVRVCGASVETKRKVEQHELSNPGQED